MNQEIPLTRDVDAIQIPSGDTISLPAGTPVVITQSLGGTYTVATSAGLARISSNDADALGIDKAANEEKAQKDEEMKSAPLMEQVWHQLKQVYDPEIPVNIADLGLIYEVAVNTTTVSIKMTLTAPGCGMGPVLIEEVKDRVIQAPGVNSVEVELVLDPPWSRDMMSEAARLTLNM